MKRLFSLLIACFLIPATVYSQAFFELTDTFVSADAGIQFNLPEEFDVQLDEDTQIVTVTGVDELELQIYSPTTLESLGFASDLEYEELAQQFLADYDEIGSLRLQVVEERELWSVTYGEDKNMIIIVPLGDTYAIVQAVTWTRSLHLFNTLNIAGTLELEGAETTEAETPTLTNPEGNWRDVIAQLEEAELIGTDGSIVFVEDRAFFTGQGRWFTPLAVNSPQTNFVMAATLSYTPSELYSFGRIENCSLLSRVVVDSSSSTTHFLQVGIDNYEALFYRSLDDSVEAYYEEFEELDLENDMTYHILFIAQDEAMTLFLDGEMVAQDLPVEYGIGTFGIALDGIGDTAECVGENIWVYRLPAIQDGVCRATSGSNVNQRQGPGTNFAIAGQLTANSAEDIIGRTIGGDGFVWWQLESDAWVRNDVVELLGDCRDVPEADVED